MAGKSNADVESFWIVDEQILTTIPTGIENFFANLEGFQWEGGVISTIDSSTFKPFPNLSHISLGGNNLVTLDADLFQFTRELRQIYLYSNSLEHVGHELLTGLADLTLADFEANTCVDTLARTPRQIQELNRRLPNKFPPLATALHPPTKTISATSEANECGGRCIQQMKEMIVELQRQMRELKSNPCSCPNAIK